MRWLCLPHITIMNWIKNVKSTQRFKDTLKCPKQREYGGNPNLYCSFQAWGHCPTSMAIAVGNIRTKVYSLARKRCHRGFQTRNFQNVLFIMPNIQPHISRPAKKIRKYDPHSRYTMEMVPSI